MSSWWIVPVGAILLLVALSSCVTTEPTAAPAPPAPPPRVQAPAADDAKSRILGYLDSIIVPEFILEQTEFQVAFSFLAHLTMAHDPNPNPHLRGISFFTGELSSQAPLAENAAPVFGSGEGGVAGGIGLPRVTYQAQNASMSKLLADLAPLYKVEFHVTSVGVIATAPGKSPFPNVKAQQGTIYKTYSDYGSQSVK